MNSDAKLDIRIPSPLKHRLGLEAVRDNRSMASVVIVAVTQYLEKKERE